MTLGGWIFLGASWLLILGLFTYCLVRTLREKDSGETS
jgi:hypothetical protein